MVEHQSPKLSVAGSSPAIPVFFGDFMIISYLRDIKNEFLKIKWISLKEVFITSFLVFVIIMFFSFIFLSFDLVSLKLIKLIF